MKRYLIDESTFKKFVAKVKASADGDKVTAIVNQPKNERFEKFKYIILYDFSESSEVRQTKKRKSSKVRSKSVPAERKRAKSSTKNSKRKKVRSDPEPESEEDSPVDFDDEQTRSAPAISPTKSGSQSPASSDYSNGF